MGSSCERVRQFIDYIKLALYLSTTTQATPIATTTSQRLPVPTQFFLARPAQPTTCNVYIKSPMSINQTPQVL